MPVFVSPLFFSTIASIVAMGAAFCALVSGFVFGYHWFRFGLNRFAASAALAAYAVVCVALLIKMILTVPLLVL